MFDFSRRCLNSNIELYGLIVPMQEEIEPILSQLCLVKSFDFPFLGGIYLTPKQFIPNKIIAIICVQCGIGKSAISSAVSWLTTRYAVKLCFHLGTAGSLNDDLKPKDWILVDSIDYHDVDLMAFGYPRGFFPNNPLFNKPSFNFVKHHPCFYRNLKSQMHQRFRCHLGKIISGEQFICSSDLKICLQKNFSNALAVDMESAAFAQSCQNHELSWMILRTISDHANSEHTHKTFRKNLNSCAKELSHLFFDALRIVDENYSHPTPKNCH